MLDLGERSYPLCLLDTNALSEMAKDDRVMRHFYEWALGDVAMIPCFSPFSLLELRRSPPVFERFIERFEGVPCAMTKGYIDLLIEERDAYPDPSGIEALAVAFMPAPLGQEGNRIQNLPWMMDQYADRLQTWSDGAPEILAGMRSNVPNYPPAAGSPYTPEEVRHFVWQSVFTQLALHDETADFVRATINGGDAVETDAFRSQKAMAFTVFYKFYADASRTAHESDVMDMLIASALPYVEAFVAENHQAESLRKVRQRDDFLGNLEVFRLRDFRSSPPPRR